ncbi:MAG: ACT domain-containing protein [Actinomycetota bacterium]|nr:ACT domain-containing protein [Actinomycetota bacterium]
MQSREVGEEVVQLRDERERLKSQLSQGAGGYELVTALADSVDRAITRIWWRVRPRGAAALVAVGGYGRRELCPSSDIDLMILHAGGADVTGSAKALLYELWDAGMQVGHSIRTTKEALKTAKQDFDAETAFLDARLVTGDAELFHQFHNAALRQTRRSPDAFLRRISRATHSRRSRAGDASAELEPNLKDGKGGLRDLHTIAWIDRVCGLTEGVVEQKALRSAGDLLYRARSALHFITGRQSDVLLMQLHAPVAASIDLKSFGDGENGSRSGTLPPEETLMRSLYRGCREIAFALDWILDPEYANVAESLPDSLAEGAWTPEAREAFFAILRSGPEGRRSFRVLEQTGALARAIPEWEHISCLPQRNVYHRNAVDVHSFETAAELARFAPGTPEPESASNWELLTRRVAVDAADRWDLLLLAALLHDIGKGADEDHSMRGEALARKAAERIGLEGVDVDDVAWLVRNHLLLTKSAVRRNLDDESLIVELGEMIASVDRLRLLYLLSASDGLATGPSAWTDWTAALVADLFTRVFHVLERGELVSRDASHIAEERFQTLSAALSDFPAEAVEHHLSTMPRMWLLAQSADDLIRQSRMMIPPLRPSELRLDAAPLPEPGSWALTLVAQDRPGLFSKVSGVLALHGLNVLTAQIVTRQDGVALEVFRVQGTEEKLERVEQDIGKALRGKISLDLRLAQKRQEYAARVSKGKQEPPSVRVDNQSSDFYTVIEVHATDRIGLLYTVTRALTELELDIHLAKVATYGDDVVDVFYVWDLEGQKVTDAEHISEIKRLIPHRLELEA